jgi:phosphonate transport system permease protein
MGWWSAHGIGFSVARIVDGLQRENRPLQELLRPDLSYLPNTIGPFLETLQMAVIAAVIGCSIALPASFLASKVTMAGRASYGVTKSILNVVRSIPDLLYAMVFVAALSIGPLPGVLALILFNIGVTAKLTSETIDAVDTGPLEAAFAAGAGHVAALRTAVLPQVLPSYVAFSLYVFELNLRASTVLGIVGAGGVGVALRLELSRFRYDRVSAIIIGIFAVVFVLERISIALRRRLV